MSSLIHARRASAWRAAGHFVTLHFIELASADEAVARVAGRVASKGAPRRRVH